jgi:uncharacterized membrane protein
MDMEKKQPHKTISPMAFGIFLAVVIFLSLFLALFYLLAVIY